MPLNKRKGIKKGKKKLFSWLFLGVLVIGLGATILLVQRDQDIRQIAQETSQADTVRSTHLVMRGYNLYSPTVLYDEQERIYKMWFGGWLTKNIADGKVDFIYYSTSADKIHWTAPVQVFKHPIGNTIHANDPSVVKVAPNLYVMVYTAGTGVVGDPNFTFVYRAISSDGIHWGQVYPLIEHDNGFNDKAAWSPSVVIHNNKYYVYYHDITAAQVLLSIFDFNFNRLSTQRVTHDNIGRINVDVQKVGDKWYMFYDTGSTSSIRIERIESTDGVTWDTSNVTQVVTPGAPPISAITPFALFDPMDPNRYSLYFAYGNVFTTKDSNIFMWEMTLNGAPPATTTPTPVARVLPTTPRFRSSAGSINVRMRQGEARVVTYLGPSANATFVITGKPVNTGRNIRWQTTSGTLIAGQAFPIRISVARNVRPGRYRGRAKIYETSNPYAQPLLIPVTIQVVDNTSKNKNKNKKR